MELYNQISQQAARTITKLYSTSFSAAALLFTNDVRRNIYNIYGLVRLADEVVDSYRGDDAASILDDLEAETYRALKSGYSTNLIVQAFTLTARQYDIDKTLVQPFFTSMRADLSPTNLDALAYKDYIYGSAEVVGLMCLKVFCPKPSQYKKLRPGAQALGAAFQKINFLRDFADDYHRLGRCYFPGISFDSFDESAKAQIIDNINHDLAVAANAIKQLPAPARPAVKLALRYYSILLKKMSKATAEEIKHQRFRVNDGYKLLLFARCWTSAQLNRGL